MAREIELISTSTSVHYLLFGLNSNELSDFSIQIWIEKFGVRVIDWCQATGLNFISFMGGDLWVHNSNTAPRCNLFGEQKECKMGIVANGEPTKVKLFDSLGIYTDGQWEVESLIIPPSLNKPNGMYSKIPKERFKNREGVWRAEFLRNMKSTSDTARVQEAISGEQLKGNECYMILKNVNNPEGDRVRLYKLECNTTTLRM